MKTNRKPLLALDFDGVIHGYDSGWQGAHRISDPPVPGAGAYLIEALQHFRVAIFSSRSKSLRGRIAMRAYVRNLLWDAALANQDEAEKCWAALSGTPVEYSPWTLYDVRDLSDQIGAYIEWPWFKPPAAISIDDRALTFTGNWSDFAPERLRAFKPWNK